LFKNCCSNVFFFGTCSNVIYLYILCQNNNFYGVFIKKKIMVYNIVSVVIDCSSYYCRLFIF